MDRALVAPHAGFHTKSRGAPHWPASLFQGDAAVIEGEPNELSLPSVRGATLILNGKQHESAYSYGTCHFTQ